MAMTRSKKLFAIFDRRLSDPEWLSQKYHNEDCSVQAIANIIGCSTGLVEKKMRKLGLTGRDKIIDVYTGRFHGLGKKAVIRLMKPYIKVIKTTVDEIYTKTKSRNSKIFKETLADMERLDEDTQSSSALSLGLTRKEFYILLAKFFICLYDYDTYYAERIDYVLKEVIKHREDFYLDEISDSKNWYPNRPYRMLVRYVCARNLLKGEQSILLNASELLKSEPKPKTKTKTNSKKEKEKEK